MGTFDLGLSLQNEKVWTRYYIFDLVSDVLGVLHEHLLLLEFVIGV